MTRARKLLGPLVAVVVFAPGFDVDEPDRRAEYQAVAPAVEDGLYLVPKVIE